MTPSDVLFLSLLIAKTTYFSKGKALVFVRLGCSGMCPGADYNDGLAVRHRRDCAVSCLTSALKFGLLGGVFRKLLFNRLGSVGDDIPRVGGANTFNQKNPTFILCNWVVHSTARHDVEVASP